MNDISTGTLFTLLAILIVLSAFFSSSETGLMSLNRYRLRHLAERGHRGALLAQALLKRPDRLLGIILLGNNFVNILASALATIIALRLYGEAGIAIATGLLTFVVLIFAEVAPKTLAALHPERIAFPAAYIYTPLLRILYPLVFLVNIFANSLLRILGVKPGHIKHEGVSVEELRSVVRETSKLIPQKHQDMLMGILNLENATVDDIMVPRNEILAVDLEDDWDDILKQLTTCHRTRIPFYRDDINNIVGVMHMRRIINLLTHGELTRENLEKQIREAYFIPEGTSLYQQLENFQHNKRRTALAVDEYGDVQGLVTLEDILEEVVGEFTTTSHLSNQNIQTQDDDSFLISGNTHIREINRSLGWHLPVTGPKTLNGLILEHMEMIPEQGTSLMIAHHPIEIIKTQNNAVQIARVMPTISTAENSAESSTDKDMDGG
ncbi:MAG: HlyC/CorC family transporter [Gammaproteobacteria bacterium]|nr:HlyC/CorC family transporter [Gammaproteobacteria bacterium]MCW8909147.1 HlyC/CorC family transporter [Gammaproteobacteria bacterium]MCW9006231.1 HlyC/CorC family transporter [Gammaproteobacteria bacterium]